LSAVAPIIGTLTSADLEWARTLNNAAVPDVNDLAVAAFTRLVSLAPIALTARRQDVPVGFLLAFRPGTDYASPNYRWFCERLPDFLYIDRVVVEPNTRRGGVGRALYAAAAAVADGADVPLTCEVNEVPPNPGSMAFHDRFGFRIIGRQETEGGTKRVALMRRDKPSV
jgi:predicted GNAT superfamily acetyltransferase